MLEGLETSLLKQYLKKVQSKPYAWGNSDFSELKIAVERAKAFIIDLEALQIEASTYVDNYLFVRLQANTLTSSQQACLQTCPKDTACWYCFADAVPSIPN